MALLDTVSYVVTVTASAAPLTALSGNRRVRWLSIQPDVANVGKVYVGGPDVTTETGHELPIPVDSKAPAPFIVGEFEDGTLGPENVFIVGTADDKVRVFALVYVPPGFSQKV